MHFHLKYFEFDDSFEDFTPQFKATFDVVNLLNVNFENLETPIMPCYH